MIVTVLDTGNRSDVKLFLLSRQGTKHLVFMVMVNRGKVTCNTHGGNSSPRSKWKRHRRHTGKKLQLLKGNEKEQNLCRSRDAFTDSQRMKNYPGELGLKMPFKEKKSASPKAWSLFFFWPLILGRQCCFWLSQLLRLLMVVLLTLAKEAQRFCIFEIESHHELGGDSKISGP